MKRTGQPDETVRQYISKKINRGRRGDVDR